ncbi:unnamed protein product [Boreogadus saida]
MAAIRFARAALGMNMPSWRSRRPACVGIMPRQRRADTAAIAEWADDFTVPLDDALSLLVSSESDDSRRGGGVSLGFPSPNGEARGNSIARLCRHLTSSGWSFGGRATGHYRQGSRKPWPCGAHASGPQRPGQRRGIWGLEAATRPTRLEPIWPMFPAISSYFSGAAAEPGRLGALVKTFIQNMNHDIEEKGIVGRECLPLEPRFPLPMDRCRGTTASALQEAEVPKRCPATIPFSSMFSLLQIDVDVEEPGTSENPTRSFEIHNIGSDSFLPR